MTTLGEAYKVALKNKELDVTTFIWKGSKVLNSAGQYVQTSTRLVDMGKPELKKCYNHCERMLFNSDSQNPGRYPVLKIIEDQKNKCGAELFLRWVDQNNNISRFSLISSISGFLTTNHDVFIDRIAIIDDMFSSIPEEYKQLPLNLLMDGCLDRLGTFNKKHITRTFILRQGIWLTREEIKELSEDVNAKGRLETIRENLNIREFEKLHINSKGVNYTQMRAMLNLKPNKKFMELTTIQLETLRYRILFNLEETVKNHIVAWENRMNEIMKVAEHNNIIL